MKFILQSINNGEKTLQNIKYLGIKKLINKVMSGKQNNSCTAAAHC